MPFDVTETTLPGVGKKFEVYLDNDRSISIIVRQDGHRDVFYREDREEDYAKCFEMTDSQARTVGLFLVGAYYQPVAAEIPETTEAGEHIEWYSLMKESSIAGQELETASIEERTGVTILGIEHEGEVISAPEDSFNLEVGCRLIAIGDQNAHDATRALLEEKTGN